ncbi:hypothetical protein CT0861_09711 [Colletotrichum tofieldiae]|uniref:Uncharacterized protein n=1 Tax=Colletotrichum tofieldiae TaxID=708197 RepID=A0A161VIM6_9PEZI|nr:hypothetical protein CT0861_09711 [Colletotrichum tofieldiae]
MEHTPLQQRQVDVIPRRASSASSSKRHSKVDSTFDAKNRSSADTTVDSTESTNSRSIPAAFKASWGKKISRMLGKWNRAGAALGAKPAPEPSTMDKKKSDFVKRWDKRLEELLNRPDPSKLQLPNSVTAIDVTASHHDKNRGLLKRRSLGNIFDSVRSRNTLKKRGKLQETLAETMGSGGSTQPPAKDLTASENAPPTLPKLPPSGDLGSSFQGGLEVDQETLTSGPSAPHPPAFTPTRPPCKDQAVQTPLTSTTERTDAKGEGKHSSSLPGLIDLRTGHELVWKTLTNPDTLSVLKCNALASSSKAKSRGGPSHTEAKVTEQLVHVPPANKTVDSTHTTHTRDLIQIPRIGKKQEVRRSLKGDQVFIYSDRRVFWIPAANRCKDEASNSAATARNDAINSITAGTDIIDMPSNSPGKNLKRKAKSLTFVKQLEIQPRDSFHTEPRRVSFQMDLRGTDGGPDGPKLSFRGGLDDCNDAAVNSKTNK